MPPYVPQRQNVDYSSSSYANYPEKALQDICRFVDVQEDDVVLDVGCGDGRLLHQVANKPYKGCIGVDIKAQAIADARRQLSGPVKQGKVVLVNADIFDADEEIPLEVVTKVVVHLTGGAHSKLWTFLQGRVSNGTEVITLQHPIDGVAVLSQKEVVYPASLSEKGSMLLRRYVFPTDERVARLSVELSGFMMEFKDNDDDTEEELEVSYGIFGHEHADAKDYIGLYYAHETDPNEYIDFAWLEGGDPPFARGCVPLRVSRKHMADARREKRSNVQGHRQQKQGLEVRLYNGAGLCLGRREVQVGGKGK